MKNNNTNIFNQDPITINKSIPSFVSNESYSASFGLQWNRYKTTQLDSISKQTISEDRLKISFKENLSDLKGKTILEAGCGAGRFSEILCKYKTNLFSFDLSSAVFANQENNRQYDNIKIFQADITSLPIKDNVFDYVVCLGVLQHTPSTEKSIKELVRVLKPGGKIVCDHYRYKAGYFTSLYLIWWFFIRKIKPDGQLKITESLTKFFFPIHWKLKNNKLLNFILRRISPVAFYYDVFNLTKEQHYQWSMLDTHDRNTDYYKRLITKDQFKKVLQQCGCEEVEVFKGGTGYIGRAQKHVSS